MTLTLFKSMLSIVVLLTAVISGLWPFLKKTDYLKDDKSSEFEFPVGEALATGIFLGAGLLHMLPEAAQDFNKLGYDYPFAFLFAGISFFIFLLLEHISISLKKYANYLVSSMAFLTVAMLSIHSLLEGAAVGLAGSFATALIIFIAIIAHKGAASFALSINLNRSQLSLISRITAFSIFALMTPIGILGGNWVLIGNEQGAILTPIFNSLAAGTFIYIGTLHGLERASLIKYCCNMKEFFFTVVGFAIMAVVAIWT